LELQENPPVILIMESCGVPVPNPGSSRKGNSTLREPLDGRVVVSVRLIRRPVLTPTTCDPGVSVTPIQSHNDASEVLIIRPAKAAARKRIGGTLDPVSVVIDATEKATS
jgi:hypothetical protein